MNRIRFGARIFHNSQEPFHSIVERARYCEKQGYDSVTIDDHLLYGTSQAAAPESFTTLAALALQTRKIHVGIAVTDLVRRHPAIVAQAVGSIANMAPGRVFLGLGAGDPMNQTPIGLSVQHRFNRLREGLGIIRLLWNSSIENPVSYQGKYFTLKSAYLQTGRLNPKVPVYLAAFGEKMLQLTGEEADGWIPHCHTPDSYREDLAKIRAAARNNARKAESIIPSYYTLACAMKNRDEADRDILCPAKYFLALMPEALRKIDRSAHHPGPIWEKISHPRQQRETIRKIAQTIPDQTALATVIHGTPNDCIEQIAQFQKSGCREFFLTFVAEAGLWSTKGLTSRIGFFASKVLSHFSTMKR